MTAITRKHSAKCISFNMDNGDVRHYIFIGGRWHYNGRKYLALCSEVATADGFWRQPIMAAIKPQVCSFRLRGLVELVKRINLGKLPKSYRVYMREWTSVEYLSTGVGGFTF